MTAGAEGILITKRFVRMITLAKNRPNSVNLCISSNRFLFADQAHFEIVELLHCTCGVQKPHDHGRDRKADGAALQEA